MEKHPIVRHRFCKHNKANLRRGSPLVYILHGTPLFLRGCSLVRPATCTLPRFLSGLQPCEPQLPFTGSPYIEELRTLISVNLPWEEGTGNRLFHPLFVLRSLAVGCSCVFQQLQRKPFKFTLWGQPHPSPVSQVDVFDMF
jgi:hypothetical protein